MTFSRSHCHLSRTDRRRFLLPPIRFFSKHASVALAVCLIPACAGAQQEVAPASASSLTPLPPGVAGKSGVNASFSRFDSDSGMQSDVIFGRNLKGPYLLSWKGIRP